MHSGQHARYGRGALFLAILLVIFGCSSESSLPTLVPSPTPSQPFPAVEITVSLDPTEVRVGDEFTVTTDAGGSGIPQYTLTLGGDLIAVTRYDGTLVADTPNDQFELSGWIAGPNEATWTVRALAAGEFEVRVFVSGEVGITPMGPFSFTSDSESFQLTVLPAS